MNIKKYIKILPVVMTVFLCACGTNTEGDKAVPGTNLNIENVVNEDMLNENDSSANGNANEELSEEEKNKFASGISENTDDADDKESTSDAKDSAEKTSDFVLNDEIEETCPTWASMRRADVDYGDFTHLTYYSETCKMDRGCCILLPADYSEDKEYPVF